MKFELKRDKILRVLTFGTFDVFHIGHLRLLERAKGLGTKLIVGVSSDQMNFKKKGRFPIYTQDERMDIVAALSCVDNVFLEESMEKKRQYLLENKADVLVMGDDWEGRFDEFNDICKVIYLARTFGISTTQTIEKIRKYE